MNFIEAKGFRYISLSVYTFYILTACKFHHVSPGCWAKAKEMAVSTALYPWANAQYESSSY